VPNDRTNGAKRSLNWAENRLAPVLPYMCGAQNKLFITYSLTSRLAPIGTYFCFQGLVRPIH
jgi:hypothetical protein